MDVSVYCPYIPTSEYNAFFLWRCQTTYTFPAAYRIRDTNAFEV
ncbi:hypothetical protein FOXG_22764 [Fusarium oxysporum f. sp. lycopersici 4287]|uniref:Uncharacterized protein n=1 Tax=Fusarium oxysporum f. sp. lycopersici (strain 4287 / CBS 123668 / FGSC 9935 / NRRL 34936) TaxID=426428 RepID=A0A0J9WVV0_FUSO4|nr:uncharacterized protein FOXG_22764 [Fusarium oxysporum f. sp. lycopersici 4287]KNB20167.1 hypothetical protein FOXG_22764 [Fusarium oxysporum f. sp. lycopersici 4287]